MVCADEAGLLTGSSFIVLGRWPRRCQSDMSCPFQSFRIHSAFLFVLCNVVLLTFNIALGFKYVAPFYGNWNHHPLQVGSSWCHGQLGLDHRVSMAYSAIRRKQQQRWWFELLLVEKCGILNSSGWRNCHYNDGHVSRKHEEKRRNISNRRFRFPYPPFTRGGCIESCSAMHHRQRVNPTAISWEQHHDGGDLAWKNTSVVAIEFQNISGGVMLFNSLSDASYNSTAKNNPFITLCYDVGGLGRSSLSPPSNNMGNTADNFSLNLGKLLDSLPEDTRLIFSRKPDLNQFSDNITLIDYKGRTILRGLHFYKIFCCFLRFIGRVPGIDPLVIIEKVHFNKLENCIDIQMVVKFGEHSRVDTISKYKLEEKTGMVVSHFFTNHLFSTTIFIRSWHEYIVASWAHHFSGKGVLRRWK